MLKRAILNQVVNKYNLKKHLTSFFIPNKGLLLRNRRLTTVGLKVINIGIRQVEESLSLIL
jgi:predicted kinase